MSNTKVYKVWSFMISRCTNPNVINYHNYGGRGIKVCDSWLIFENFYNDIGKDWKEGLQLDRVDVNGNYEPSNCRWVTPSQNSKNKRTSVDIQSDVDYVRYSKQRSKWYANLPFKSKEEAEKFVQHYFLNRIE